MSESLTCVKQGKGLGLDEKKARRGWQEDTLSDASTLHVHRETRNTSVELKEDRYSLAFTRAKRMMSH